LFTDTLAIISLKINQFLYLQKTAGCCGCLAVIK